jgi:D-3-phosphoglycerate dehydrogenase
VTLRTDGVSTSAAGALLQDKGPRIVEIDGASVDIEPEGNFLLIAHMDKPGMIGKVGTVLGGNDVNIASMEVARQKVRGPAMMILHLDDDLPPAVLEKVRKISDLTSATSIRL